MTIRVIKGGSPESARIAAFSFLSTLEPEAREPDNPVLRSEPLPALPPAPEEPAPLPEPETPAIDIAQIERAAYESGFSDGEKAGMAAAEQKFEAVVRRYTESLLELGRVKPALYARAERDVVRLAVEVAKKIVHREITADREIIQTLVRVALTRVAEKTALTVHLNPADHSYVVAHRAALSENEDGGGELTLVSDKSVERGGCLVRTDCGEVDARIGEQFREVERAFFEGVS
jgi:flagellar assembly protein FliH